MNGSAPSSSSAPTSASRRFLGEISPGERVDDIFVISNVQLSTKKDGEPYLSMLISDRTGRIPARWWGQGQAMAERLPNPGIVRVKGMMKDFNGTPQFHVDAMAQPPEAKIDYQELLASTDKDIDEMFADAVGLLRGMQSPTLRAIAEAYLADECLMGNFKRAPAAMTFHHAYLGGLLDHTLNTMRAADAVCAFYPGLNRDLVVFGIFLHDLAKTWELSYETCFDYSDGGRLVGHIVKSAMWVEEKAKEAEQASGREIPRDVIDVLQHIILAHHGELSLGFGSAKDPATPEAWAVHMIENMDAKLTMALTACRWDQSTGRWTEWHKALAGRLFRPDVVALADAETPESAPEPTPVVEDDRPEPAAAQAETPEEPAAEAEDLQPTLTNPLFETSRV